MPYLKMLHLVALFHKLWKISCTLQNLQKDNLCRTCRRFLIVTYTSFTRLLHITAFRRRYMKHLLLTLERIYHRVKQIMLSFFFAVKCRFFQFGIDFDKAVIDIKTNPFFDINLHQLILKVMKAKYSDRNALIFCHGRNIST